MHARWPVRRRRCSTSIVGAAPRSAFVQPALDASARKQQALAEFIPNETLLLERLFLHLPAVPR
jgi:hypothetical protein